jgi:hypothetical protein
MKLFLLFIFNLYELVFNYCIFLLNHFCFHFWILLKLLLIILYDLNLGRLQLISHGSRFWLSIQCRFVLKFWLKTVTIILILHFMGFGLLFMIILIFFILASLMLFLYFFHWNNNYFRSLFFLNCTNFFLLYFLLFLYFWFFIKFILLKLPLFFYFNLCGVLFLFGFILDKLWFLLLKLLLLRLFSLYLMFRSFLFALQAYSYL